MNRRQFFAGGLLAGASTAISRAADCGCSPALAAAMLPPAAGRLKVTNMKVFGVTIEKGSDRPYVFVKIETDAGVVGWGEATPPARFHRRSRLGRAEGSRSRSAELRREACRK